MTGEPKYSCPLLFLVMVHLAKKTKKNGKVYLYLEERGRVNGKSVRLWQQYLGPEESAKDISKRVISRDAQLKTVEFGWIAALLAVAQKLHLVEVINQNAGKRHQGLGVGEHVLFAAIQRCAEPASKTQLREWLESTMLRNIYPALPANLGAASYWTHFRYLDEECIGRVEAALARAANKEFGVDFSDLCFDPTNFFTFVNPTRENQELPCHGHSKDGRAVLNLVNVSLACARDGGVPLSHLTYPGNVQDAKHFKDVASTLKQKAANAGGDEGARVTLVFDKGCMSDESFAALDEAGTDFIASVRPTSHKDLLPLPPEEFNLHELPNGKSLGTKDFRCEFYGKDRRLVALYNPNQAAWQYGNLEAKVTKRVADATAYFQERLNTARWQDPEKVRAKCVKILGSKRFQGLAHLEVGGEVGNVTLAVAPDEDALAAARLRLGKSFLVTTRDDLAAEAVAWAFRQQFTVENAFRQLKDPKGLAIRPMYHRVDSSIRGHVFACVVGLLLQTLVVRGLARGGVVASIRRATRCLREVQVTRIMVPERERSFEKLNAMSPEAQEMFDALGLSTFL